MPIMKSEASTPTPLIPVVPQVNDGAYRGVVVDTRYTPASSLLKYLDGAKWTVNYYRQIINSSNDTAAQSLGRPAVYQQYELIQDMLINVTAGLSSNQDAQSRAIGATGSGVTYPGIIPNIDDMFLADIGDGREGVFRISSSEKKTFMTNAVYAIDYVLVEYQTPARLKDFANKTVQTATFVAGNLLIGKNPILASNAYTDLENFSHQYKLLLNQYFATFFSREYQTLLIPDQGQGFTAYDSFLTKALLSWISVDEHPTMQRIRSLNVDGDQALAMTSLWDAFSAMDISLLPMVFQQAGICPTTVLTHNPFMNGAYFSGVYGIIYPMDYRVDVDQSYIPYARREVANLTKSNPPYHELSKLIPTTDLSGFSYNVVGDAALPDIVPVTTDTYYVFTQGFYAATPAPASNMELVAIQALQGKAIDPVVLHRLCTNALSWGNLERLYYVPVLLAILKTITGGL